MRFLSGKSKRFTAIIEILIFAFSFPKSAETFLFALFLFVRNVSLYLSKKRTSSYETMSNASSFGGSGGEADDRG